MTVQELIRDYDFSSDQRNAMFIAYDENPQGFERIAKRAAGAKTPAGALISMVRKGQHLAVASQPQPVKRYEPEPYDVCDQAVRDHWVPIILAKLGRIGSIPTTEKEPTLKIDANELAVRLLAELGEAA